MFSNVEKVFSVFNFPTCTSNDNDISTIINVSIETLYRFGMLDLMLLPFTVIMIKSKSDILQGVSKLDDLMRCSVFQKDKVKSISISSFTSSVASSNIKSTRGNNELRNNNNLSLLSRDYAFVLDD